MQYIKLSVFSRSPITLLDYQKKGRTFWDDLNAAMQKKHAELIMEKQSGVQYIFYLPFNGEKESAIEETRDAISGLDMDANTFLITVKEMDASEIEKLQKTSGGQETGRDWLHTAAAGASAGQAASGSRAPEHEREHEREAEEKPAPAIVREDKAPQQDPHGRSDADQNEIMDIASEAARISDISQRLLKKVHGQRHAVDEVVQTIFECDAFNRQNGKRRGPLATFLFTGPSGVGKTYLATQCAEMLGVEPLVVDMSEYSDNLANLKFNGDHGQPAIVTGYVRNHPNGIIIFDEIEKAHINTIYLFLQILDSGKLKDYKLNKDISFRDTIIFITTNAGQSLYDDPTVIDLSNVPRRVILEALRTDIKPGTNNEPFFPECITTRFANGHVILFNHLEPYALMQIVRDEIELQISFFQRTYNIRVNCDLKMLSALVLYSAGGVSDARTPRGIAKNMIVKELQDIVLQAYRKDGEGIRQLKEIDIVVSPEQGDDEVVNLFVGHQTMNVPVFADKEVIEQICGILKNGHALYEFYSDVNAFKRRARGIVDYILLDPVAGCRPMERTPNDLEDYDADGITVFEYLKEFFPEIPIYFMDVKGYGNSAFGTLLARGGKDVIRIDSSAPEQVKEQLLTLSFAAQVNNSTFSLGRSGKILSYNCSQYLLDREHAVIAFDTLSIGYAPASKDTGVITHFDENTGVSFEDVIGCKEAKKALKDFCRFVSDPRRLLAEGKKPPKGVLLYGPPGTGKTMLAKALASEAKAAFIPTTATSFFGSLVGESERNVRELFNRARRYAPSVIFIDEVDAIARARTGSVSTAHNEDTLNAFIAEMDGFSTDERRPVFILAATNYDVSGEGPRVLDAAFVRRFDRKIFVGLPDADDRFELLNKILARHSVHFGEDHDAIVRNLAERSSGMSNADLTVVVDMFLRECEDREPTSAKLMDALDAFRFGEVNEYDPEDLKQTACHESGHALVARLLGETPSFLTIVARKNFGGFMEHAHNEKKMTASFTELMNRVCTSLAGRAAEIEVYGKDAGMNSGASSDIANARKLIKIALNEFAMGDKLYLSGTDEECEKLMQEQMDRTAKMISEHRSALDALTELLYARKSLDQTELEAFFKGQL